MNVDSEADRTQEIPRAERIRVLLEVIGDEDSYALLRKLLRRRQTQRALIRDVAVSQSVASERLRLLRRLGLVERGAGNMLRIAHYAETLAVIQAAAALSDALEAVAAAELRMLAQDVEAGEDRGDWRPRAS